MALGLETHVNIDINTIFLTRSAKTITSSGYYGRTESSES